MSPTRQEKRATQRIERKLSQASRKSSATRRLVISLALLALGVVSGLIYCDRISPGISLQQANKTPFSDRIRNYDRILLANPTQIDDIAPKIQKEVAEIYCSTMPNCDPIEIVGRFNNQHKNEFDKDISKNSGCVDTKPETPLAYLPSSKKEIYFNLDAALMDSGTNQQIPNPAEALAVGGLHELIHSDSVLIAPDPPDYILLGNGKTVPAKYHRGFAALIDNPEYKSPEGDICLSPVRGQLEESFAELYAVSEFSSTGLDISGSNYHNWVEIFRRGVLNTYFNGDYRALQINYHRPSRLRDFLKKIGEARGFKGDEAEKRGDKYLADLYRNVPRD